MYLKMVTKLIHKSIEIFLRQMTSCTAKNYSPPSRHILKTLPDIYTYICIILSSAKVKMEIPILARSLKSSILSSTSFYLDNIFWRVESAAVGQSRRKANMVAQGDGNLVLESYPIP